MVSAEYKRMKAQIDKLYQQLDIPWSIDEFRRRISVMDASVDPLVQILIIAGRWGSGGESKWVEGIVTDCLRREPRNGLTIWLDLITYPVVILHFSYALGLLKAGRLDDLYKWMTMAVPYGSKEDAPFIKQYWGAAWDRADKDLWKYMEGMENKRTPFNNHLYDIFLVWAREFVISEAEFTMLFEELEFLGALAFITNNLSRGELEQEIRARGEQPVWSPVGRIAWDSDVRDRILSSYGNTAKQAEILEAGFCRSDKQYFELAVGQVRKLMGRISWW